MSTVSDPHDFFLLKYLLNLLSWSLFYSLVQTFSPLCHLSNDQDLLNFQDGFAFFKTSSSLRNLWNDISRQSPLLLNTLQRFPITNRTQLCSFFGLINAPPVEPCLSLQPPRARPIILVLCKIPHGHMHHAISLLTRITFLFFPLWLTPSHLPPTFISGVVKCYSMHTNPSQYLTLCIIIIFWCVLTRLWTVKDSSLS